MLIRFDGEKSAVYINPEAVVSVSASGVEGCAIVTVRGGTWYMVRGSPDEVVSKMAPTPQGGTKK